MTVYAGLKGVKLCEFLKLDKANQDCQWKMPIVTLDYHQGEEDGLQPTIIKIPLSPDKNSQYTPDNTALEQCLQTSNANYSYRHGQE